MLNSIYFFFAKKVASVLWEKFATPEVIESTIKEIKERFPKAGKGLTKFYEVVEVVKNLTDGKVSKQDIESFVQFIYRYLKPAIDSTPTKSKKV